MRTIYQILSIILFQLVSFSVLAQGIGYQNDTLTYTYKRAKMVFLPAVTRSIETSWSFGLAGSFTIKPHAKDSLTRTTNFQTIAMYSLRKQFVLAMDGTIYFPKEKYILSMQNSFSYFPDKWWGIGNNTADANEESYEYQQYYIYPHLQRRIFSDFYVGVLLEVQRLFNIKYNTGGLFDQQNVIGRNGSFVAGLGFSLTWDTRNTAFSPTNGSLIQLKYNNFNKSMGSEFHYWNLWVDFRKYQKLSPKTTLAFQSYIFLNEGDVPIRSLASLGGDKVMRGYYDGRFRDKSQLTFQAEYRFPIFKRFSGVAFGGWGDVSDRLENFRLQSFKYSYGAGLRFALNPKERLNLRIDYGIGQGNSNGLYFMLGEAF
jgi:outer membrane protein assembly factor BamA